MGKGECFIMKKKKDNKFLDNAFLNVLSISKIFEIITGSKSFKMAFSAIAVGSLALNTLAPVTEAHAITMGPQAENFSPWIVTLVSGHWLTVGSHSPLAHPGHVLRVTNGIGSAGDIYVRVVNNMGMIVVGPIRVNRGSTISTLFFASTTFTVEALTNTTGTHIITID